ncbi:hypothetical protein LOK49_LG05G01280 [Camellia lanceoleosa]|uniref:Uncharacterized protein n=1 Tax=Camellia lanceoleosa TaxID=1840588 RepID=A0ACC0HM33_9ERIC|nr:hypothetical protein LOK49_LG05G01280 [Camellia lanceoleosa]
MKVEKILYKDISEYQEILVFKNVPKGKYDAIIVNSLDPVVELANEASDGNANQECLDRISQLSEIEDLQSHRDPPLAPLFIKYQNKHHRAAYNNIEQQKYALNTRQALIRHLKPLILMIIDPQSQKPEKQSPHGRIATTATDPNQ